MHDRVWIVSLIIWNLKFQFCELWKFRIFNIFPVNINKVISISTLMLMKESKRMHKFVEWSSATMTSITKTFNDWNSVFMKSRIMKYFFGVKSEQSFEKLVKISNGLNRQRTKGTWLWFTLQININGLSLALNQVLYKRG